MITKDYNAGIINSGKLKHLYFQKWLKAYGGRQKLADKLGVSLSTVKIWDLSYTTPTVEYFEKLIKLSKGTLTFQKILDSTHPRNRIN